mmetsp:Transcript_9121/g.41491  ORF Transcript_9121/g.41491 Transcript_9121/m.41491 type:complete len:219 (+) Transcript_9121:446-1102(+)
MPDLQHAQKALQGVRRVRRHTRDVPRCHLPNRLRTTPRSDHRANRRSRPLQVHRGGVHEDRDVQDGVLHLLPPGGGGDAPVGRHRCRRVRQGCRDLREARAVFSDSGRLPGLLRRSRGDRQDRHRHPGQQVRVARGAGAQEVHGGAAYGHRGELRQEGRRVREENQGALRRSRHGGGLLKVRGGELRRAQDNHGVPDRAPVRALRRHARQDLQAPEVS